MTLFDDDYEKIPGDNRILLSDWYLMKSVEDHLGKRLAVGGESTTRDHTLEIFHSAPIVQRLGTFRLKAADGMIIMLNGIINSKRTRQNDFPIEAIHKFNIGFPFTWEIFADRYIERDATASSGGSHDSDANEAQKNSAGRARRVRIALDDTKARENIPFSNPGRSISTSCSYTKKFKAKADALLVDVKLPMGSDITAFNLPLPCESTRNHTTGKCLTSTCGSAPGSIPEFGNGRMHLKDGKGDEMISSQQLSDQNGGILVLGSQSTEGGAQQNGLQDCESTKTKGGCEANIDQESDLTNIIASSSISVHDFGGSMVKCVIENERHQTTFLSHTDLDKESDDITMKVRDTKVQTIIATKSQTRLGIAKSLVITTTRRSSRLLASQRVPSHEANLVQVANGSISVEDSNRKSPRNDPQMNFEGCNERPSSRLDTKEHNENQSRRSLRKIVSKHVECKDAPATMLSKKEACMESQDSPASVVIASPPAARIKHRISKTNKKSVCSWSNQQMEQNYSPSLEDGNIAYITDLEDKHVNGNQIEESVKGSAECHLKPTKAILSHKEAIEASGPPSPIQNASISARCCRKSTRSRTKTKMESFQGNKKEYNSLLTNGDSEGIISPICCPEETEVQIRSYSESCSIKRCKLSNTRKAADAKCKMHFDRSANTSDSKTIDNISSPLFARYDRIEGQIEHNSKLCVDQTKATKSHSALIDKGEKRKFSQRVHSTEKSSSNSGTVFNLKLSSSGRLVVPPLAYWRNEQVVYDKDGNITCISDGSKIIQRSTLELEEEAALLPRKGDSHPENRIAAGS